MHEDMYSVVSFKGQDMVQYVEDKALIKCENDTKVRRMINSTEERGNINGSSCSLEIPQI